MNNYEIHGILNLGVTKIRIFVIYLRYYISVQWPKRFVNNYIIHGILNFGVTKVRIFVIYHRYYTSVQWPKRFNFGGWLKITKIICYHRYFTIIRWPKRFVSDCIEFKLLLFFSYDSNFLIITINLDNICFLIRTDTTH